MHMCVHICCVSIPWATWAVHIVKGLPWRLHNRFTCLLLLPPGGKANMRKITLCAATAFACITDSALSGALVNVVPEN